MPEGDRGIKAFFWRGPTGFVTEEQTDKITESQEQCN